MKRESKMLNTNNIEKMGSYLPNEIIWLSTFPCQAMLDGNLNQKVTERVRVIETSFLERTIQQKDNSLKSYCSGTK